MTVDAPAVKSTHRVEVVRVHLDPHPNADTLSIARIWGYSCVVRTADWREGDLAAYVVPDSLVPTDRPEFEFLGSKRPVERIRVKRLRGVVSLGLLIPAPPGVQEGDDVAERLGVTRYEPPLPGDPGMPGRTGPRGSSTEAGEAPPGIYPVYDVEAWHRYRDVLVPGETVVVTEKIHGANLRCVWRDGRLWVGSRNEWKRPDAEKSPHLDAVRNSPWLESWCRDHEGFCVYGEAYGRVASLRYGRDDRSVLVFDILDPYGNWMSFEDARRIARSETPLEDLGDDSGEVLRWVPILFEGAYDPKSVLAFAEGSSRLAPHVREGCVVRPIEERTHPEIGRVQLKIVGNGFHESGK